MQDNVLPKDSNSKPRVQNKSVMLLCLLFLGFYLMGWLFPDLWWGTHSLAFLPVVSSYVFFVFLLLILFWGQYFPKLPLRLIRPVSFSVYFLLSIISSLIAASGFYLFPIAIDAFGDSVRFEGFFREQDNQFKPAYLKALLSFDIFHAKNGEKTVLNLMHLLSTHFQKPPREMFQWMTTICGGLYVLLVSIFTRFYSQKLSTRLTIVVMFLLAPYMWIFFGHMEIYTPTILSITLYSMILVWFFNKPTRPKLLLLLLLLYLSIKLHTVNFLLIPSFVLSVLWLKFQSHRYRQIIFTWKFCSTWFLLPVSLVGLFIYIFVAEDYNSSRLPADTLAHLFLPIISPAPPLDRYNLFSASHIFDFFNMLLLMSAAACFVIIASLLFFRKSIQWNRPEILSLGLCLILMIMLYFAVNPLLGMPLDADLYTLPGPLLILLAIVLFKQLEEKKLNIKLLCRSIVALSLMTIPALVVNNNGFYLAQKIESIGVRTFQTYWIASPRPLLIALNNLASRESKEEFDHRVKKLLDQLQPYAIPGSDLEYAATLNRIGNLYSDHFGRHDQAIYFYEMSQDYDPGLRRNMLDMVESYFVLGQQGNDGKAYAKAYTISQYLLAFKYPDYRKALRISIHCAIMARSYDVARLHAKEYHVIWPDDAFIKEVSRRLEHKENLDTLQQMFSAGGG